MKTAEEVAKDVLSVTHSFPTHPSGPDLRALMARAIEADRAQRKGSTHTPECRPDPFHPGYFYCTEAGHVGNPYEVPMPLAGVIEATSGGVFRNDRGDYLVEPIGDETGELILVCADDGSTATLRGDWETGWQA